MTFDQLADALVGSGKWSREAVALGVRAAFKCEYCDVDLLSSVEAYKSWECDHIVPTSRGGGPEDGNLALACRTCNFCLKRSWDPRSVVGPSASRQELIAAIRNYVAQCRTATLKEVALIRAMAAEYEVERRHPTPGAA